MVGFVVSIASEEEFFQFEDAMKADGMVVRPEEYDKDSIRNSKHFYFKAVDNNAIIGFSAFCYIKGKFSTEFYHRGSWVDPSARGKGVWSALFVEKLRFINDHQLTNGSLNFHTVAAADDDTRYRDWEILKRTNQETDKGNIRRIWYVIRHELLMEKYGIPILNEKTSITVKSVEESISKYQYTKDNHFVFGYNGVGFSTRSSISDEWFVRYGKIAYQPGTLREEALKAAQHIRDVNSGPIDILFSGGSDSEIVLRAFVDAGIKVRCNIIRYDRYINAHDWAYATVVCDSLGVKPVYHDLDLLNFYESGEYETYSDISNSVSPQLLPHMWLINKLDGVPVLGSGECYTARTDIFEKEEITHFDDSNYPKDVPWVMYEREKVASWYRFPMKIGRPAVPGFFQYRRNSCILSSITP
jgi:GNAT superfamily N-acetyltransferase